MNNSFVSFSLRLLFLTTFGIPVALHAQEADESDSEVRENPVIEQTAGMAGAPVHYPPYIRHDINHIDLNGADWSGLRTRIAGAGDSAVSFVHIGDSHLQADFATAVVRERLQRAYGSHGRGLIIPFRLAGTNEPTDYVFSSPDGMITSRLLKMPWPTDMTFTGVAVAPVDRSSFRLRLKAQEPFDALAFHATADGLEVKKATLPDGTEVPVGQSAADRTLYVVLPQECTELTLTLSAPRDLAVGGVELVRGRTGVSYHVIGNNGATYSTYSLIGDMGRGVAGLHPDMVIISLGTNEAFGRISSHDFRKTIDELVSDIRRHNPSARLLLVTPAECYRRSVRRVRRRRGKRRRTRRVTSYSVNPNIARMRDVIIDYGKDNHIPVYDWYAVAGGEGAAARWLADKNLGRDRIHLTAAGYRLQGALLADALSSILNPSPSDHK